MVSLGVGAAAAVVKPRRQWADHVIFYIFMSSAHIHDLRMAIDDVGLTWGDYLVWVKNAPVLSRKDYNQRTELIGMGFPTPEPSERGALAPLCRSPKHSAHLSWPARLVASRRVPYRRFKPICERSC